MDRILTGLQTEILSNNLRDIREYEGLSQGELAILADVSVDTLSDAENQKRRISRRLRQKIVNGLNANPKKLDTGHRYVLEDIFPNSVDELGVQSTPQARSAAIQPTSKTIHATVSTDLHRRIRVFCAIHEITIESFVTEALAEKLLRVIEDTTDEQGSLGS